MRGDLVGRWLVGVAASAVMLGATGCGVLTAVTNPKAAWAVGESTPLSVVVRRAEVAHATADQVQRLIGDTGVDDQGAWLDKAAIKTEDAKAMMDEAAGDAVYAGTQTRVVQAEAWAQALSAICSEATGYPNLLAALGPDVGKLYGEIASQEKTLNKLRADLAVEEKALDAPKISASDKATHEKQRDALKKEIDKTEDAYDPKVAALLKAVKANGSKAPPAMKDKLKVAIASLRTAVSDAKNANSASMLRYPIAVTGLLGDVQKAAPRFVADVIEEKTGTRPDMNGIKPDVKLDGTNVKLTVNGLTPEQLKSLSMGDLVAETTKRMEGYVKRVVTLVAYADETQHLLSFEADLLDAYSDGLGGGAKGPDLGDLKVQAKPAATAVAAKADKPKKGPRSIGGLALAQACKTPKTETVVADTAGKAAEPPKPADGKPAKGAAAAATASAAAKPSANANPSPAASAKGRTASAPVAVAKADQSDKSATVEAGNNQRKPGEAKAEVFIFSSYQPGKSAPVDKPAADKTADKGAPAEAPTKPVTTRVQPTKPAAPAPSDCSVTMERDGKKICL